MSDEPKRERERESVVENRTKQCLIEGNFVNGGAERTFEMTDWSIQLI